MFRAADRGKMGRLQIGGVGMRLSKCLTAACDGVARHGDGGTVHLRNSGDAIKACICPRVGLGWNRGPWPVWGKGDFFVVVFG